MITRPGFAVGRVAGLDVRVDRSWPVVAVLLAGAVWRDVSADGGRAAGTAPGMAAVVTAGFFVSVLAHELAHAFEARHRGWAVRGVTVLAFGGVTHCDDDLGGRTVRIRDELAVTAVGLFTTFVLAGAFGLAATVARVAGSSDVALACGMLGWLNVGLGLFNLLPGAPLDGGRALQAPLARLGRSRRRAAWLAAGAGSVVAGVVMAAGAVVAVRVGATVGVGIVLVGWLLLRSAAGERTAAAGPAAATAAAPTLRQADTPGPYAPERLR